MTRTSLLVSLCLLLACCARPATEELFVSGRKAVNGVYEFALDFTDSSSTYDIAFYTRVDRFSLGKVQEESIALQISWISPKDSIQMEERVWMPCGDLKGVKADYRTGIHPTEAGVWTLLVRPKDPPRGFRGLGLIITRNGTR